MSVAAHLVIGADSFVGSCLIETLRERGHRVYGTTRRKDTLSPERLFCDFADPASLDVPPDATCAHIVAAATDYARCASVPESHTVNTVYTPRLAGELLNKGLFVSFVSSNSVFGGDRPWPHEDDPHDARFPYSIQKDLAEKGVLQAARDAGREDHLAIVRLTKVLGPSSSPLPAWLAAWREGRAVRPFADLIFAPVSRRFAALALAVIGERRASGSLHVSGAENISYVAFAHALAEALGVDPALISPTTATAEGVEIPFKPQYSGLGMTRTTACTGLKPQTIQDVIADLALTLDSSN